MAYIPESHLRYNLLPNCAAYGVEAFACSSTCELEEFLRDFHPLEAALAHEGYGSYAEYAQMLCSLQDTYSAWPDAVEAIEKFIAEILDLNRKENGSVCRYIGKNHGGISGLTCGQTYYWPCSASNPQYLGVIDHEESINYWYSPNPKLWLIADDPTGMAARTMIYYQETKREKRLSAMTPNRP